MTDQYVEITMPSFVALPRGYKILFDKKRESYVFEMPSGKISGNYSNRWTAHTGVLEHKNQMDTRSE